MKLFFYKIVIVVYLLAIAGSLNAQFSSDTPKADSIKSVLDRIYNYLDEVTQPGLLDRQSNEVITDLNKIDTNTIVKPGDFRLAGYEWGVVYSGMLLAGTVTKDKKYTDYVIKRLQFIAGLFPFCIDVLQKYPKSSNALRYIVAPHSLDDAGPLCMSMIKAERKKLVTTLRPIIDNYIKYINTGQFRLKDGTLARNQPQPNTLWLDDMFMGVPALAQMGALTGEKKYFDEAVKQVKQFSDRLFIKEKGIYKHGWTEDMKEHPALYWARANGWALLAMVELLDVLPTGHPGREAILELLEMHCKGLASYQSAQGSWHQLLDHDDSFLETSATAIYTYCMAHAVGKGWLDARTYIPVAIHGWNAIAAKVNNKGQVEGTCVGTGVAYDAAYYYNRPVNVTAPHGYGTVLLAGAAVMAFLK